MTATNQQNPDSFDYKKYSLGQLENWIHDVLNSDASPREIHDCIYEAMNEEYWYHKSAASRIYTLMELMAGNKPTKNQSWTIPVECDGDDCVVTFPDELIEKTGWKEGDILTWIDNGDGTFSLIKKDET